MKILSKGQPQEDWKWRKKCKCRQCKCKVELEPTDVRYYTISDYGGGCEYGYDWVCPNCPADNNLTDLPAWIEDLARKAWQDNGRQMVDHPKVNGRLVNQ